MVTRFAWGTLWVGLVLPVVGAAALVLRSLWSSLASVPEVSPWAVVWATPGIGRSIALSLGLGLASGLLSLLIVFGYLAATASRPVGRWIPRLLAPILAMPHAAAAFGLAFLLTPSGLLWRLVSPWMTGWQRPPDLLMVNDPWGLSLLFGLLLKEVPFLLLVSLATLAQVQPDARLRVAAALGYAPVTAWWKTVAPALYPLIRLPLFAVMIFAASTVDVAVILGPTLPPTLAVRVLEWVNDPDLARRAVSAAGALVQVGVCLAVVVLWRLGEWGLRRPLARWWVRGARGRRGKFTDHILPVLLVMMLTVSLAGLMALVLFSTADTWRFPALLPAGLTWDHWHSAAPALRDIALQSVGLALVSTALGLALVLGALEHGLRRGWSAERHLRLIYLPLLVPQVVFLLGLATLAERFGWRPGWSLVALGHLLFIIPYALLTLSHAYQRLDPRWSQIAAALGATPAQQFWKVRLPLVSTPLLTAAALGMAISIGLYLPTQVLGAGRVVTLTTEAIALASGGNRTTIAVWALVQAWIPMLGFLLAVLLPPWWWRQRAGMRSGPP